MKQICITCGEEFRVTDEHWNLCKRCRTDDWEREVERDERKQEVENDDHGEEPQRSG